MGVAGAGDDLAATGNAVAARIDRVPADEWDDAHWSRLRASALDWPGRPSPGRPSQISTARRRSATRARMPVLERASGAPVVIAVTAGLQRCDRADGSDTVARRTQSAVRTDGRAWRDRPVAGRLGRPASRRRRCDRPAAPSSPSLRGASTAVRARYDPVLGVDLSRGPASWSRPGAVDQTPAQCARPTSTWPVGPELPRRWPTRTWSSGPARIRTPSPSSTAATSTASTPSSTGAAGSTEIADEITSATFERALRALPGFRWREGGFQAWIYRIAANELASHYRRAQRQHSERGQRAARQLHEASTTVEHRARQRRQRRWCSRRLGRLNERYQRAITLRYLAGLLAGGRRPRDGAQQGHPGRRAPPGAGRAPQGDGRARAGRERSVAAARGRRPMRRAELPRRAGAARLPAGPAPRPTPGRRHRGPALPGVRRGAGLVRGRRCSRHAAGAVRSWSAGSALAAAATLRGGASSTGRSTPGYELQAASGAVALFPDGASRPVHAGDQIPPGGLIQTGPSPARSRSTARRSGPTRWSC